jgi:hypothetical protein
MEDPDSGVLKPFFRPPFPTFELGILDSRTSILNLI